MEGMIAAQALALAQLALLLVVIFGAGVLWLTVDYLAGKRSTHQVTMLNPDTLETRELNEITEQAGFGMPSAPEDQMGSMATASKTDKKAFEDAFDNEYDNIT